MYGAKIRLDFNLYIYQKDVFEKLDKTATRLKMTKSKLLRHCFEKYIDTNNLYLLNTVYLNWRIKCNTLIIISCT